MAQVQPPVALTNAPPTARMGTGMWALLGLLVTMGVISLLSLIIFRVINATGVWPLPTPATTSSVLWRNMLQHLLFIFINVVLSPPGVLIGGMRYRVPRAFYWGMAAAVAVQLLAAMIPLLQILMLWRAGTIR